MIALSFLAAAWLCARGFRRAGVNPDYAWDLAGWAAICGILGAKTYYLLLHFPETAANPWAALLSRSGLVWYGGFIGGAPGGPFRVWRLKLPLWEVAGAVAPALGVGCAIGRVGGRLGGCDEGGPGNVPA